MACPAATESDDWGCQFVCIVDECMACWKDALRGLAIIRPSETLVAVLERRDGNARPSTDLADGPSGRMSQSR